MKKLLFIFLLSNSIMAFCQANYSKNQTTTKARQVNDSIETLIDPIEIMPVFPGGDDSMFCFIESNLNYKILNYSTDSTGRLLFKFVIDSTGLVRNVELLIPTPKKVFRNKEIETEVSRVLKLMPKWKPATMDGKKVSCGYTYPFFIPYSFFKCSKYASEEQISSRIDFPADFKFGNEKTKQERVNKFIKSHLKYPVEEEESSIQGVIYVKCTVEPNGELKEFKIIRSLDPYCDREAIKAIKQMPNWVPAIKNDKPVRSEIVIPIIFKLE